MHLVAGKPIWLCAKKAKHANKKAVSCSLYKGTLFEDSKASPKKIVELLYCFSLKMTYVQTSKQTGANSRTIEKWFTIFRQICLESIEFGRQEGQIGGLVQ